MSEAGGVADIYLMPNLVLAILKPDSPTPLLDGLAGNWLGRFSVAADAATLAEALNETIAQECPGDQICADDVESVDEPLSPVTFPGGILSRIVKFGEIEDTIKSIGAQLGIPRTTLIERVKKWPDIPVEMLFAKKLDRLAFPRYEDAAT